MLLTGFPSVLVRSPDCTTWGSLRATNQNTIYDLHHWRVWWWVKQPAVNFHVVETTRRANILVVSLGHKNYREKVHLAGDVTNVLHITSVAMPHHPHRPSCNDQRVLRNCRSQPSSVRRSPSRARPVNSN